MSYLLRALRPVWVLVLGFALFAATHPAAADPVLQDVPLGKADAPVTIYEYASLTCPHCAHFTLDILPKIKADYIDTGKAKLIFRDFPLDGLALRAQMLARCGGADRYYGFLDVLFRQQQQWATAKDQMGELKRIAKLGGISDAQFDACMNDKKVEDYVLQSRFEAQNKLKIDSTPTLVIDGKTYPGAGSVEELSKIIDAALKK